MNNNNHDMRVLIVDDSRLLQSKLNDLMLKIGRSIEVAHAYTCKEAMNLFFSFSPDTIILDILLPDGSGTELLRVFKTVKPSVKVIMFTNYSSVEFMVRCRKLHADHFLDKSNMIMLRDIIR